MGEKIMIHIGECFVEVDEEYGKQHHERLLGKAKSELELLNETNADLEKQMKELRAHLYAKFGANINLDDEA
jgi:prefoldin subunit 4